MPKHDDLGPAKAAPHPEVVIVGAGPSGLMLACELALADIRTVVLERLAEPRAEPTPSGPLEPVMRMVDHRGLALPQTEVVATLTARAVGLGVEIHRNHELVDLEQDGTAVTVAATRPEGPYLLRADYLVGADGAHSMTRERAGIGFSGSPGDHAAPSTASRTRIAERMRDGRVFLVGEAAHAFGSHGRGPGLAIGLADAMNLGWKLAAAVLGDAGLDLLDSYERERRPAAERVAADAQADADTNRIATTDVRYDMGGEQRGELDGRFAPEMTLQTPGGPVTLAELTTRALPLLVDLTDQGTLATAIAPWHDEVDVIRARCEAPSTPTTALFLRPDCFVAWSSTSGRPTALERDALRAAAERWLGPGRE